MLLIIPWRGWAPRILARCCSTGPSRRFLYLANSAAGRSMALVLFELPGRCTSAPAASERAGGSRAPTDWPAPTCASPARWSENAAGAQVAPATKRRYPMAPGAGIWTYDDHLRHLAGDARGVKGYETTFREALYDPN